MKYISKISRYTLISVAFLIVLQQLAETKPPSEKGKQFQSKIPKPLIIYKLLKV